MKKILICCDFLMTKKSTQDYHLRWFYLLVSSALKENISPSNILKFTSGLNKEDFQREIFFKESNLLVDTNTTHYYFDPNNITVESKKYLKSKLEDSLIIGYELSNETRAILNDIGMTYIDVWLHPIRFMDDNFYAFYSNSVVINKVLEEYHLSESYYYLYANKLKIHSYMGWNKYEGKIIKAIKPNSALFIGQTLTDKAVCNAGVMLNVLNYKSEFKELTNKYSHVYFSRHPMLKGDDQEQIEFIKSFNNTSIIDIPAYKLLATEQIQHVASISSSVVLESKYFEKTSEYFFKPVVNIHTDNASGYYSVYNQLHSNIFWFNIIKNIFCVEKPEQEISFLEGGSIYRDMLSLYYNNACFDKQHATYTELYNIKNTIENNKPIINKNNNKNAPPKVYLPNMVNFDRICKEIDKKKVISFDIFDTLVQRKVFKPSDVIRIVAIQVFERFGIEVEDFIEARTKAKGYFAKEEVTLLERYYKVIDILNLEASMAHTLCNMEMSVELVLLEPKSMGVALFEYAKSQGKKIIVVSDTYFSEEFIRQILKKCNFTPDEYYISSELNKTKEKGSLFKYLRVVKGYTPLHIGDNVISDYEKAIDHNIQALVVPANIDVFLKNGPEFIVRKNSIVDSIHYGLIQNKLTEYPAITSNFGFTKGSSLLFGYTIVGRIMLAFAAWIIEYAQEKNINQLYFLARDGEIVKKVTDKLIKNLNIKNIQTNYLLASRRAVRVCSIDSDDAYFQEVESFTQDLKNSKDVINLFEYLQLRFGFSQQDLEHLELTKKFVKFTANDLDELLNWLNSSVVKAKVLNNAKRERENYLLYLEKKGLTQASNNMAFIDIGHSGSLQASLVKLLNLKTSHGLYFATYSDIVNNLDGKNHKFLGFYRNKLDRNNRNDFYIRNALIIESIFLNDKSTFLYLDKKEEQFIPVYLGKDQKDRVVFNRNIHKGSTQYVDNYLTLMNRLTLNISLKDLYNVEDICKDLSTYLKKPSKKDTEVFEGVSLENYFAARPIRYYVPSKDMNFSLESYRNALWKKGTEVFYQKELRELAPSNKDAMHHKFFIRIERFLVSLATKKNQRKKVKYEADPVRFFRDSRNVLLNTYYLHIRKLLVK